MSDNAITVQDIKDRINDSLAKARLNRTNIQPKLPTEVDSNRVRTSNERLLKLALEIDQVNRKWNVDSDFKLTSHRPKIGRFIVFGKKVVRKLLRWYVKPAFMSQSEFNGSVTRSLNLIQEHITHTENALSNIQKEHSLIYSQISELQERMKEQSETIEETLKKSEINSKVILETLVSKDELASLKKEWLKEIVEQQRSSEIDFKKLENEIEKIEDMLLITSSKIKKLNAQAVEALVPSQPVTQKSTSEVVKVVNAPNYKLDYMLFEYKFRGSRKTIIDRQRQYLPYFIGRGNVLDIGCGRGEFIELLQNEGITVSGIDLNSDMISYCQERGFNVKEANAIEFLATVAENTYDGIFMAQVIEHIPIEGYIKLLEHIRRVLRPNGILIIETINVQSVYAMSNWFYIDPTHDKPVHPNTLEFVMQGIGYSSIEKKYLSPVEHVQAPELIIDGIETEPLNKYLAELTGFIYGHQDYALIAKK